MSVVDNTFDFFLFPFKIVFVVLSWPIRIFTWIVLKCKKDYDPERLTCPGCGFRGDSGTNGKTCTVTHRKVESMEKACNEHRCYRCDALYYTKLFKDAKDWIK